MDYFLLERTRWIDKYYSMDIKAINLQVNEQTNSGLQRKNGQLIITYMNYSNFTYEEHGNLYQTETLKL